MNIKDDLIQSYGSGKLLEKIQELVRKNTIDENQIAAQLVELHNKEAIDIVNVFKELKNEKSGKIDFFHLRHIFKNVLPELEAPLLPVMHCVNYLYQAAGHDLAAGAILSSFAEYCSKKTTRPIEAIDEVKINPDLLSDLLPAILKAGSQLDSIRYLKEALILCKDENTKIKHNAIFVISLLNLPEDIAFSNAVFITLEKIVEDDPDDITCASIVKSAYALLQWDRNQEDRAIKLFITALSKGDDNALHESSILFNSYSSSVPIEMLNGLIKEFPRVKSTSKNTLQYIDWGVSGLIKSNNYEKAIQLLEGFLTKSSEKITMGDFTDTAKCILNNNSLIGEIFVKWSLSEQSDLIEGLYSIIKQYNNDELPLDIDQKELSLIKENHIISVARKTIGFLLISEPITAASILIALMRVTSKSEIINELSELLYDPLLINFTGKTREYVKHQNTKETGDVKVAVEQALEKIEQYIDQLNSIGNLPALHPSESQREAYLRDWSRLLNESSKESASQSIIFNLIPMSRLLYGSKAICTVTEDSGQTRRVEVPLQVIRTTMESPRMLTIAPFELEFMIWDFKREAIKDETHH